MKTTKQIIAELQSKGHSVRVYTRTDTVFGKKRESYRIIGIDSKTFKKSGSTGNFAARAILSEKVTKGYITQRKIARSKITKPLSAEKRRQLARYNYQLKKLGKPRTKATTARRRVASDGGAALTKSLRNTLRHYRGKAYTAGVEFWIDYWAGKNVMPRTREWMEKHKRNMWDADLRRIVGDGGGYGILQSG